MSENSEDQVSDPQLAGIKRAFNTAFTRLCASQSAEEVETELSNVLAQFYRLSELCKKRLGTNPYHELLLSTAQLRTARAIVWARGFDTHEAVVVAELGDRYSSYYTTMYWVPIWRPLHELPQQEDRFGRHDDYQAYLEDQIVLDTVQSSFNALAELVEQL